MLSAATETSENQSTGYQVKLLNCATFSGAFASDKVHEMIKEEKSCCDEPAAEPLYFTEFSGKQILQGLFN